MKRGMRQKIDLDYSSAALLTAESPLMPYPFLILLLERRRGGQNLKGCGSYHLPRRRIVDSIPMVGVSLLLCVM